MASVPTWKTITICVFYLAIPFEKVESSQEVMKKLTTGFAAALDQCKKEMSLGDHILEDFVNFWREEYNLVNRDVGCAIICMATKFDLVTEDFKMHHDKAHEFAKKHGADDTVAKQLVTMIKECEKIHEGVTDDCNRVLEIAKCFRTKIHALKWAPSMEIVLEEVMTEM